MTVVKHVRRRDDFSDMREPPEWAALTVSDLAEMARLAVMTHEECEVRDDEESVPLHAQELEEVTLSDPDVPERFECLYRPGENLFSDVSAVIVENGWSIFPQERDGRRAPARIDGEPLRWKEAHHLDRVRPSEELLTRWNLAVPTMNTALVLGEASGRTFAVDIDCKIPSVSKHVEALAEKHLGGTLFRRVGREPKVALVYRYPEGQPPGYSDIILNNDGESHRKCAVEILNPGRALTIYGIHHETRKYFQHNPRHPITGLTPQDLPEVSPEALKSFLEDVEAYATSNPDFVRPEPRMRASRTGTGQALQLVENPSGTGLTEYLPPLTDERDQKWASADGERVTSGREAYLSRLVFYNATRNGQVLLEMTDALAVGSLTVLVRDVARRTVRQDRKWPEERLESETERKAARLVSQLRSGGIQPYVPRQRPAAPAAPAPAVDADAEALTRRFRCLGRRKNDRGEMVFYFMSSTSDIVQFPAEKLLRRAALVQLDAREDFWVGRFPKRTRDGVITGADWERAGTELIAEQGQIPLYDPEKVRGRGIWLDDIAGPVLHAGDRVYVDRKPVLPGAVPGDFIYDNLPPYRVDADAEPLTDDEGQALVNLMASISWTGNRETYGLLMAGWIVAASVCGGMPWRSHAWLVADRGQGKSWLLDNILSPLLGGHALKVQGQTTEAALRRSLGQDARPVLFDEAETQTHRDRERIQSVLNLARAASSENGPEMLKSSVEGDGVKAFRIRSSFLFQSINNGLTQSADESRTIVFEIRQPSDMTERTARFDKTKALLTKAMVPGVAGRLLARALQKLPEIRRSCEIFHRALTRNGCDSRTGDTFGSVLAAGWLLRQPEAPLSDEHADAIVRELGIADAAKMAEPEQDYEKIFGLILQLTHPKGIHDDATVAEAIRTIAFSNPPTRWGDFGDVWKTDGAKTVLAGLGISVKGTGKEAVVSLAVGSIQLSRAFEGSMWAGEAWHRAAQRCPGAEKGGAARIAGRVCKVLTVPVAAFMGEA